MIHASPTVGTHRDLTPGGGGSGAARAGYASGPEMSRSPLLPRLALSLTSAALSLGIAEVAVRALGLTDPAFREPHPVLGWAPVPGAHGMWNREGHAYVAITEHGFRGVDVAPGRPDAGTLRIALVGDSYVEARQVALEASIGGRLATDATACAGRPVEVLSFGVSGYGTAQEYLLYRERVAAYHPDLVVLAFLTGNDIADNQPDVRMNDDPAPYFSVAADGALVLDGTFRDTEQYRHRASDSGWLWVQRRSHLVRVLRGLGGHGNGAARGELGLSDEIYAPPATDAWRDAWARTEAILAHHARDVRADGADFAVVTLSNAIQVDPDPEVRERYRVDAHAESLEYPDRRIAEAGARDGYRVLNLAPTLRAYAEEHDAYLHGFPTTTMGAGHWNERGHELASRELARWLCAEGLTRGGR